jgi:hypothetical protein
MPETNKRVVVQLNSDLSIPYVDQAQQFLSGWDTLLGAFPPLELNRFFTAIDPAELLEEMQALQGQGPVPVPPMLSFFAIEPPPDVLAESLAAVLRMLPEFVADAYVEAEPLPAGINPGDDPLTLLQGYLLPSPFGIDALDAWNTPGVDGSGMQYVIIDQGWQLDHPDFSPSLQLIGTINFPGGAEHGTQAAGIISMADNSIGGVGIAPRAVAKAVSIFREVPFGRLVPDTANAILIAMKNLNPGDVILLEVANTTNGIGCFPNGPAVAVESDAGVAAAITLAMLKGFVIIEPAGNGCVDMDTFPDHLGRMMLNRAVADTGAIMVGAAQTPVAIPGTFPPRASFSSFGSRVDCYAWGTNAVTVKMGGPDPAIFCCTSAASAIIAGAALSLQGMVKAKHGQPMTPIQLRQLLSDSFLNTPSFDPASDQIGVMPNLKHLSISI